MRKFLATCALSILSVCTYAQNDTLGVFAMHGNEMVRMEKITHQAVKGSGGLASMASFGLAKIKAKLEFKDATSPNQFEGAATLRLYFGKGTTEEMIKNYMFTSAYSIKDFSVAQFEVKKGKRMLTGVSSSLMGSSVGVAEAEDLNITTKEIRSGVYDITVSGKPGEYCLMFTANGTGGFGGVFDFTIK